LEETLPDRIATIGDHHFLWDRFGSCLAFCVTSVLSVVEDGRGRGFDQIVGRTFLMADVDGGVGRRKMERA
jgi:hypothetical protein